MPQIRWFNRWKVVDTIFLTIGPINIVIHNGGNAEYHIIPLQFNKIFPLCTGREYTHSEDNWII